jgi:hypothetical protein
LQVRDLCGTWSYNLNARASEKCQRKDWSVHKQECYNNALWNQKLERPFLQRKEMTVIYCSETAVPFDDLDLQAKYNFSNRSQGYEMGLTVRFASKTDLEAYGPHPRHQAAVAYMKEVGLVNLLVVDFEIEDLQ